MMALVVIGVALFFVVHGQRTRNGRVVHTHAPSAALYLVIVGLGVVAAVVVQLAGYRIPALRPDLPPEQARSRGLLAFQQSMILRFAISESIAIIAIALLFASKSNTVLPYVLAGAISMALMAYHVWPGDSLTSRVQQKLDRNGGRSDLANALNGTA